MLETLVVIHFIGVILTLGLLLIGINMKTTESQKYLILVTTSVAINLFGYLGALLSSSMEAAIICDKIQLFGLIFINTFLIMFISKCCNFKLNFVIKYVIFFIDLFFVVLIYTNENHSYYYSSMEFVKDGIYPHLVTKMGPGEMVLFGFNIILFVFEIGMILKYRFINRKNSGSKILFLLITYLFPLAGFLYYISGMVQKYTFIPFSLSMLLALIYFTVIVYIFRFSDSVEMGKEDIIQNINEGFLVIDVGKNLLMANDIAYRIFPDLKVESKREDVINMLYSYGKTSE